MGMRIAVLSRNFSATGGGAERYSIAIVEQLAAQHEVHVFAQHIDHRFPGVTYHTVGFYLRRPRWINQLGFAVSTWWATRTGFDIVHSHENVWHGNVQTVHVLPVRHSLFHGRNGWSLWMQYLKVGTSPRLMTYLWLEKCRYTISNGRRVVVASDALRDAMLQAYPGVARAMEVITPGVAVPNAVTTADARIAARGQLRLPEQGACLLFVGNDIRKKGLPTLIKALARLVPDVYLAVVSHPDHREAVAKLAAASGAAQQVFFLGAQSQMDCAYRAATALVHPTLQDSYAMVVLEAFAHGLPVVVSGLPYCGIASDLTHRNQAWVLSDPQDAAELEQAIRTVLTNAALASTLAANGLAFARAHSWERAAALHTQLFETVAGGSV
jgi:UDP-glucose:(heptosyl)LPS alpha-1,3-glucosyltransferase